MGTPSLDRFALARRLALLLVSCLSGFCLNGCTAVSNPVFDSVPVRLLPPELLGPSKAGSQTIPLSLLRQPQPDVYRLDHGDVLGIYLDGIIGDRTQPVPLQIAPLVESRDIHRLPP